MIRQRLTGLAAVLLLATALAGIPLGLLTLDQQLAIRDTGGNGIWDTLTRPDDGTALLTALFLVGWVAWLVFALTIVLEVLSRLRGVRTPRIPTLRLPQQGAAALVGAAALLFTIAPAAQLTPPTHANPNHPLAEQHDTSATTRAASGRQMPARPRQAASGHRGPRTAADGREPAAAPTYVVQPGDSLWSIAEHQLGDGSRWHEISDLNAALIRSSRWLQPGWRLHLPATDQGTTGATDNEITVAPGDTLSELASRHLHDANRWPDLYEANRLTIGPDPDLILPGQQLSLPAEHLAGHDDRTAHAGSPAPNEPRPPHHTPHHTSHHQPHHQPDADLAASSPPRSPGSRTEPLDHGLRLVPAEPVATPATPATNGNDRERTSATPAQEGSADQITGLRALLATAVCLSAGTLALLLANRRRQLRRRPPGRAVPASGPEAQAVERAVTEAGDQPAPGLVDTSLRALAADRKVQGLPLPAVGAATLTATELTLHLTEPADRPPESWRNSPDGLTWTTLLPDSPTPDDPPPAPVEADGHAAPYPALVSVGQDPEGRTWLLDLENTGPRTRIECPDEEAYLGLVRFLAAELAVNAWSHAVEVLLPAEIAHELVDINPERLTAPGAGRSSRPYRVTPPVRGCRPGQPRQERLRTAP